MGFLPRGTNGERPPGLLGRSMPAGASTLAQVSLSPPVDGRLGVAKTYKLYIGGAFPRSESGRSYPVTDTKGRLLAHAALASRKDVRDAVSAARAALPGWSGATAYNRGQVLYRVAEMLQARRERFVDDVVAAEGISRKKAGAAVDAAIDRWVWYAGWTDKIAIVLGSVNPVAGPYVNFSTPVPTGVVGVLAPAEASLTGLVDVLAPVLATGCTAVVVASTDVPGGVVNVLTGRVAELGPWLAAHADVDGLDLAGAPADIAVELERTAAETVKRVLPPGTTGELARLRAWTELTTVWHPVGR